MSILNHFFLNAENEQYETADLASALIETLNVALSHPERTLESKDACLMLDVVSALIKKIKDNDVANIDENN